MNKRQTIFGAVAGLGLFTTAALGLSLNDDGVDANAAAHASLAADVSSDNADLSASADASLGADASADEVGVDDLDVSAHASLGANADADDDSADGRIDLSAILSLDSE
jgi:hypothetical protein